MAGQRLSRSILLVVLFAVALAFGLERNLVNDPRSDDLAYDENENPSRTLGATASIPSQGVAGVAQASPANETKADATAKTEKQTAAKSAPNQSLTQAGKTSPAHGVGGPEVGAQVRYHVVRSGDTAWDIAKAYGVDVQTVLSANGLSEYDVLRVGQTLTILPTSGLVHTVRSGESLWDIARMYKVDVETIVSANSLQNPDRLQIRQELIIPGASASAARADEVVDASGRLLRAFSWPASGRITSNFGPRWGRQHEGIDIGVGVGTPVRASADGVVTFSGWGGGYGYLVIIDHGRSVETRYGHNSRLLVNVGERVTRGQVIARSGNTGNSTGPHVHFEIRQYGRPVDPTKYLR